jgi:hypothetical protein
MSDELQEASAQPEPSATPDGDNAEPQIPEGYIPEADLRALQSTKDREVAEARREAAAARQRLEALEASFDQFAQGVDPELATQMQQQRRANVEWSQLRTEAQQGRKYQTITGLADRYNIPLSAFQSVLANPAATMEDANRVVLDYHHKQAQAAQRELAAAQKEQAEKAAKQERSQRKADGSDALGVSSGSSTGDGKLDGLHAEYQAHYEKLCNREPYKGYYGLKGFHALKQDFRKRGLNLP